MLVNNEIIKTEQYKWISASLFIVIVVAMVYGWTLFEPFAGDALMHLMDDTKLHSLHDLIQTIYCPANIGHTEQHRLWFFHRPVFNEWYIPLIKKILGINSFRFRAMTMIIHIFNGILLLALLKRLKVSCAAATLGACALVFSPAMFFGFYDFGLSFSQLLVFFATISLLMLYGYLKGTNEIKKAGYLFGTLISTFLVVFTKESAILWPGFMVFAILFYESIATKQRKNFQSLIMNCIYWSLQAAKKNIFLIFGLFAVAILYLYTRYVKLGSLTYVAAGIGQSISFFDSIRKFFGYLLFAIGIPTNIFEPYISVPIVHMNGYEIIFRLFLAIFFLFAFIHSWKKSRSFCVFIGIMIVCTFLPIIKVARNSPYYGDLMSLPFAMIVGVGFDFFRRCWGEKTFLVFFFTGVLLLISSGAIISYRYTNDPDMWLARSQGYARAAISDFSSAEGSLFTNSSIVGVSGMHYPEPNWAISGNESIFGSGLITNLGVNPKRIINNVKHLQNFTNTIFIDFLPELNPRKVGPPPLMGYGKLISAYFPCNFKRVLLLRANDGRFIIKDAKVVRITCKNSFNSSFAFYFEFPDGSVLKKTISKELNVSPQDGLFVLEFVAPPNSTSFYITPSNNMFYKNIFVEGYVSSECAPAIKRNLTN